MIIFIHKGTSNLSRTIKIWHNIYFDTSNQTCDHVIFLTTQKKYLLSYSIMYFIVDLQNTAVNITNNNQFPVNLLNEGNQGCLKWGLAQVLNFFVLHYMFQNLMKITNSSNFR